MTLTGFAWMDTIKNGEMMDMVYIEQIVKTLVNPTGEGFNSTAQGYDQEQKGSGEDRSLAVERNLTQEVVRRNTNH